MGKAVKMEEGACGAVDFATHLRMGAVEAKVRNHADSLKHCRAALKALAQQGAAIGIDTEEGGSGGGADVARAHLTHLAVAYHNCALQLAQTKQLQDGASSAKLAHELAEKALPADHRWTKAIGATDRLLGGMTASIGHFEASLRPHEKYAQLGEPCPSPAY